MYRYASNSYVLLRLQWCYSLLYVEACCEVISTWNRGWGVVFQECIILITGTRSSFTLSCVFGILGHQQTVS